MVSLSPRRIARGLERRAQMLRHRGHAVRCPICELDFSRFRDDWDRAEALCWRCGAHERHRAQWLLLERRPELLAGATALLHFAPEWTLRRRLAQTPGLRYVTADLTQPDVDVHLDITAMELGDDSFDAVICSHVLEHIPDDAAAMRELRRITAPGGWCLVMVPLDLSRARTYEDPSITEPAERHQAFWRSDHVRLYAPDVAERLAQAGFSVETIAPRLEFGDDLCRQCGIGEAEYLWLCRPQSPV